MVPRCYPTNPSNGRVRTDQLVSVSGLTRWVDYIPVKDEGTVYGTYENAGAVKAEDVDPTGLVKWVDYIPVFLVSDTTGPDNRWRAIATGYIPVEYS